LPAETSSRGRGEGKVEEGRRKGGTVFRGGARHGFIERTPLPGTRQLVCDLEKGGAVTFRDDAPSGSASVALGSPARGQPIIHAVERPF
jgi:hypothetical protein